MPGTGELVSAEVLVLAAVVLGEVVLVEEEEVGEGLSWLEFKVSTAQFEEVDTAEGVFLGVWVGFSVVLQFASFGVLMLMLLMVIWGCLIYLGAPGASGFAR